MNGSRGININLAGEPLKNTRFFRAAAAVLLVSLAGALLLGVGLLVRHQGRAGKLGEQAAALRESTAEARLQAKRLESRAKELSERRKADVDFVNEVILRKSFSWVELLSRLEEALPSSSVVVSLSPSSSSGGAKAEAAMTAVFPGLNDLLRFIRNLYSRGFSQVRLISEKKDGFGRLEAQIAVVYEGTL